MEIEEATMAEEGEHHEMRPFAGVESSRSFIHGNSFLSTLSSGSCTISYTRSAKCYLYIFILLTCASLIVGGAFTSIFIEDKNINGAVCAFFSAAISLGNLSLFVLHLFGKLESYHDEKTLNGLKLLGMIVSVVMGILLGVYTILAFLNKQAFSFYGLNYFSSAVFSGLCLATSLKLYIAAQWYQNALVKTPVVSSSTSKA